MKSFQGTVRANVARDGSGFDRIRNRWRHIRDAELAMRRQIWQRWQNPTGASVPVFLVGCGRSGTSMIVHNLNRSWQVQLYNENHPPAFYRWRLRDLATIETLIEKSYARFVIFKPILDSYRVLTLLAHFPTARVLFVFRHYNDVVNSSLKRFGVQNRINHVRMWIKDDFAEFSAEPPPEASRELVRRLWKPSMNPESGAALYWLFQNSLFFNLGLNRLENIRLIQYEALVQDPEPGFRAICEFIGLEFEAHLTDGIFSFSIGRDTPPDIDPAIREACDAMWAQLGQAVEQGAALERV